MAKVDLTLGESKSKDDLTLEGKPSSLTWDEATMTWDSADTATWDAPRTPATLESKTKVDLTLSENK